MKKEETSKYNPLIAKFMGYEYEIGEGTQPRGWYTLIKSTLISDSTHREYLCRNHLEMKYHKSWNWLMPVVKKILNINTPVEKYGLGGWHNTNEIKEYLLLVDIEKVYEYVIEYIEWYNSEK